MLTFGLAVLWVIYGTMPAAAQDAERERVAVMPIQGVGASEAETSAITDRLREVMVTSDRFTMVDRSQMEAILTEQALQQASCSGAQCAVEVGRILGVRKIVTGRVTKFGENRWQVSAIMVDVETAETVGASSVRHAGDIFSLLDSQIVLLGKSLLPGTPAVASAAPAPTLTPTVELLGAWSEGPPLNTARTGHAGAVLGGNVIVLGGVGKDNAVLPSVEVLGVGATSWAAGPALPEPRRDAAAAEHQGVLFLIGGRTAQGVTHRVDILNGPGGSWKPGPALPSPREGAASVSVAGRLLVIGGRDKDGVTLRDVLALSPAGDGWLPLASMRTARAYTAVVQLGEQIYVIGGFSYTGGLALITSKLLFTVELYNVGSNTWTPLPDMPISLSHHAAVAFGRSLIVFGGNSGSAANLVPQNRWWRYSIDSREWSEAGTIPGPAAGGLAGLMGQKAAGRAGMIALGLPDRALLIGGRPDSGTLVSVLR